MEPEHSFGAWARRRRRVVGLTQGDLASLVGCAEVTVQKIEADERRPSAQVAALLATHLMLPAELRARFAAAARGELAVSQLPSPATLDAVPPAPAPAPTAAPAHNLPLELTSFVGRERELAAVAALLPEARLLTLTGSGGTGKTRLALRVAREALPHFPNGVRLVELAPLVEPGQVLKALAETLGLHEDPGRPLLRTIADTLQRRRLLLLLDNCEHLIDACAHTVAALLQSCPSLTVLASSRELLGVPGECVFRLSPLALPEPDTTSSPEALAAVESVQLFVARACAVEPAFIVTQENAAALARICRRLDGIPLALELAAARMRHLTIEQIAERLDERFRLLRGGVRTAPPRHQTLAALIDWSYALLNPAERALLARLAVFAGGWSLEAVEAACGGGPVEDPLETLSRLTDKSLVQVEREIGRVRYHMLETIRQYALEKLAASGEADGVRARHARFFIETAPPINTSFISPVWLAWARREQENLRAALAWAERAEGAQLPMLELAFQLGSAWMVLGFMEQASALLERALNIGEHQAGSEQYLRVSMVFANGFGREGKLEACYHLFERLLGICRSHHYRREEVDVLERLGWARREQGDAKGATMPIEQGLTLAQTLGLEQVVIAMLTNSLAGVAILREDAQGARALLEPNVAHSTQGLHPWATGWALNHLGHAAQLTGEYAQAEQLHQESVAQFLKVGDDRNVSFTWAYQSLGETALGRGDVAAAQERFARGLQLSHEIHDWTALAWCLAGLGTAAACDEEPERAARLWGGAARLRLALGCRSAPAARASYERAVAVVRAQLGPEVFAAEWPYVLTYPWTDRSRKPVANQRAVERLTNGHHPYQAADLRDGAPHDRSAARAAPLQPSPAAGHPG